MLTLSSSELSSDSSRSWLAVSIRSITRAVFLDLLVSLLLDFLSATFLALASRALAVRALAFSTFDCVLLMVACELGASGWKLIVSRGGAVKLQPAENRKVLGSVENSRTIGCSWDWPSVGVAVSPLVSIS